MFKWFTLVQVNINVLRISIGAKVMYRNVQLNPNVSSRTLFKKNFYNIYA